MTQPQSGHVAIKSVSINYVTCSQSPHFLRLGNLEVNEGESAELQCLANGASVWASQIKLQTWEGTERAQAEWGGNLKILSFFEFFDFFEFF